MVNTGFRASKDPFTGGVQSSVKLGFEIDKGGRLRFSLEGDFLLVELLFPLIWSYPLKKKKRKEKKKKKK